MYGKGKVVAVGQLSSSLVYHGQFTANNVNDIHKVEFSDLENISELVETLTIEGGRKVRH